MVVSTSKSVTMRPAKLKASSAKTTSGPKRGSQDRGPPDSATPKAMKDPNWRTRQDTKSSDFEDVIISEEQTKTKLYSQATQFHSESSHHDRSSSGFSILDKYSSESSSASDGFVKVLKKIDLKPIDGRQMSIFELDLRPETPTPTIASDDRRYVKVSQTRAGFQYDSSSATDASNSLQAMERIHTPDLFQVVSLDRLCRQSSSAASSQLHESRNIYERDKEISFDLTNSVVRNQTPVDAPAQSPQTAIRDNRDQAFQRLIQRLNRDTQQVVQPEPPEKKPKANKPLDSGIANDVFGSFRQPVGGDGRRHQTISDFKIDYWDNSQASTTSRDGSEDTVQCGQKQNTWNPKAREFLSLGHQQNSRRPLPWDMGASQEKSLHNFNPLPTAENATWPKTNTHPINPYPLSRNQDSVPHAADLPVGPLGPAMNFPFAAETFGSAPFLPANSTSSIFAPPQLLGFPAPMMPLGNISAQQVAAQQLAAIPYLASLASLGSLQPVAPALEKPNFASTRRPPVPKPTLPNAGAQLAYEEWIEWRKAHEPGYAVECKARQQRRSQRGKGPKEGGDKTAETRFAPVRAVAAA